MAAKYNGSAGRGPGRPRTDSDVEELVVRLAKRESDKTRTLYLAQHEK